MSVRLRTGVMLGAALAAGLLVTTVGALPGLAAPAAAMKKIDAINGKAIAAFEAGDNDKAKELLLDAVVLGKESGLAEDPALARTYLNLGLVHIEGLKDQERGARFFTLALRIDPSIKMKAGSSSDTVAKAFEQARAQANEERAKDTANEVAASMTEEAQTSTESPASKKARAREEKLRQAQMEREQKAEQEEILKEVAETRQREARELAEERRRETLEREQQRKDREQKAREEQEKVLAEVAAAKQREAQEREQRAREEREQLRKDLATTTDREKKERGEKELLTKRLAETEQREKAERAAKEQLLQQKQELEKQLASEKARLEKEMKDLGKQLAEAVEREKKERAVREDLEEERRLTKVHQTDERQLIQQQKAAKEKEVLLRAKLAEGPDLPGDLPAPLYCQTADETTPDTDVYIHCAAQGKVNAQAITLHYRPSGSARFHSLAMERSKKGWHTAMVPAALIKGRMLQYYVQAENARGRTAASNGKAASPNVIMINRWPKVATATATASTNPGGGDLVRANTRSARKARSRRR